MADDPAMNKLVQASASWDFEALRAELAQIEAICDRIAQKVAGLPVVRGTAAGPMARTLNGSAPRASAGGIADRLRNRIILPGSFTSLDFPDSNDDPVGRPAQRGNERKARQQTSRFPFIPNAGDSMRHATEDATFSAIGQRLSKTFARAGEGITATNGALRFGGIFSLGAQGFMMQGMGRLLGPVAGYAAALMGTAKMSDMAQKSLRETFKQALSSNRTFTEVMMEELPKKIDAGAKKVMGGIASFAIDEILAPMTKFAYTAVGGGLAFMAENFMFMGRHDARNIMAKTEEAIQLIEFGVDKILRRPTKYDKMMNNQSKWNTALSETINAARQKAEEESKEVALTLRNLGVPAHMTRIKAEIVEELKKQREIQAAKKFIEVNPPPGMTLGAQQ